MASKMGEWAFLIGVVLALIFGIFSAEKYAGMLTLVLVVLGLIVGFLNISEKETTPFLVAAAALMLTGISGTGLVVIDGVVDGLGKHLQSIVTNIGVFVTPAAVVVALKSIKALAKD